MEVLKCWKIVEFPKISIKMKNCKTFYKFQTARRLKEGIQGNYLPDKILLLLWNKNFLREIYINIQTYRHLLSKCFKIAFLGSQEMVQFKCFFWLQVGTCLAVLRKHVIFNAKWDEVCKMSEVFWAKLYRKISLIFCYFLLALRVSASKSEIKKNLMRSTGTYRWI